MKDIKIGIIGFGNVCRGFLNALLEKNEFFRFNYGMNFIVTAITDIRYGNIYAKDGLPLNELALAKDFSTIQGAEKPDWNTIQMIRNADCNVIVELSYTDLRTGEPAVLHCREAFLSGKHVVTSNKGPVALHYKELSTLARQNGLKFGIEGSVMSGSPALRLGTDILFATGINEVRGIFNGTTNFILTEMGKGNSYEEALITAQDLGYAEADPTGDVEGYDCAGKVSILAQLLFGFNIHPMDIDRTGITGITPNDIAAAQEQGMVWKLIGSVKKTNTGIETFVKPMMLPESNPLAHVSGAGNAIQYKSDLLGEITLTGPGAGRKETAAAIIEDLIAIYR